MKSLLLTLAFMLTFSSEAHAKPNKKQEAKAAAPVAADPVPLWTAWYTVVVGGQAHGYYREEAEERPAEKRIALNQHWWEENPPIGVSETMIGAVGAAQTFTPVAFYVEQKTEIGTNSLEGRTKGKTVNVTMNPSGQKISVKLGKDTIWSSQVALLMAEHKRKGTQKPVDFSALVEDPKDKKFSPKPGRFQLTKEKATIRGEECFMVDTLMESIPANWWITAKGKVCKISIPSLGAKIELADEAEAKGFLKQ